MKDQKIADHSLIHDRMHGKTTHEDMQKKNIHNDMHLGHLSDIKNNLGHGSHDKK